MGKALGEIGYKKAAGYFFYSLLLLVFKITWISPGRIFFLRLAGARIGRNCVIHEIKFFNLYRGGFRNLTIGDDCFIGDDTMLDMADKIILKNQVTIAERATVLTHANVGYNDHPLQKFYPKFNQPVIFDSGCFVGCGAIILAGVTVGQGALLAAGSVAVKDIPAHSVCAGVPAKPIKSLK